MGRIPLHLGIARPLGNAKKIKGRAGKSGSASSLRAKLKPELKKKIFERDDYTCQCCGFKAKKYQEILFKNRNLHDQREDNLATCCIFCHQCFNLQEVGVQRSGVLLWLPEIEQHHLHHIARAVYVARISQGDIAEIAREALDMLMERREEAKRRIETDDPSILASVLGDYLSEKAYVARKKKLDGVRLFPLDRRIIKETDLEFNQFPQILAYWRSKDGPFGGKIPQNWVSIYQGMAKKSA